MSMQPYTSTKKATKEDKIRDFKESGGYEIGGMWYPRVTKIVEIKAKPALYRFYAQVRDFDEGERIKEASASEGTLVHETVEALLMGQTPPIPPSIRPSVEEFMKFVEQNHIQVDPSFVEYRIHHKDERYAGTMDAMATIGGKLGVLDIKTSLAIYRDYNLQTSAYMAALKDDFPTLETRWILRIDQQHVCPRCGATMRTKGGRKSIKLPWQYGLKERAQSCVHEWGEPIGQIELKECSDWEKDYKAFLGAKKLWEWENEEMLKEIGYLNKL
jgi:hypothetical protein